MTVAISAQCVSNAKWPVSKKRTSAAGMSRLNASAPAGKKNGSSLPHTADVRFFDTVGLNRVPALAQPLLIGIAVLRDDRSDALRVLRGNPQTDRRAVIKDVDCEPLQAD